MADGVRGRIYARIKGIQNSAGDLGVAAQSIDAARIAELRLVWLQAEIIDLRKLDND